VGFGEDAGLVGGVGRSGGLKPLVNAAESHSRAILRGWLAPIPILEGLGAPQAQLGLAPGHRLIY